MSDVAIRAVDLSKCYRIGERHRPRALREVLTTALHAPLRAAVRLVGASRAVIDEGASQGFIWALKNATFEVRPGDVVGVIGRNGAGKSTVLRILSRITDPTEGYAEVRGRVGSLLEVGTGFHSELTGRENIFLNGAILGMTRREIERKFDEIVAFAEVDRFIDTPVKFYSSGMYVRLAFAVAAHLEPEILLVDEVLAVGDAAFQRKCLGKMDDAARQGRTVLFVSHQMNSIRRLCNRCVWLDAGRVRMAGATADVVGAYEAGFAGRRPEAGERTVDGNIHARFLDWEILDPPAEPPNMLTTAGPVTFRVSVQVNAPIRHGVHGIALWNAERQLMWGWAAYGLSLEPGLHQFVYALPSLPLKPGAYSWHVSLSHDGSLLDEWNCVPDLVIATDPVTHPRDEWSGILNLPCRFRVDL